MINSLDNSLYLGLWYLSRDLFWLLLLTCVISIIEIVVTFEDGSPGDLHQMPRVISDNFSNEIISQTLRFNHSGDSHFVIFLKLRPIVILSLACIVLSPPML